MKSTITLRSLLEIAATIATLVAAMVLIWLGLGNRGQAQQRSRKSELPLPAPFTMRDGPTKGSPTASVVLVEFSDFQCPFCARFASDTLPELDRKYIDTGRVLLAFRDFPLEQIHPLARQASKAASCAWSQQHFWPMHDLLFRHHAEFTESSFVSYADTVGLNRADFTACLSGSGTSVDTDVASGKALGITVVPSFLLGTRQPDGLIRASRRIEGARPLAEFEAALDKLLSQR